MEMKMSIQEHNDRKAKSYKMLLWFAMISIVMVFAGLTSAYVISKSRPDWLNDFTLPSAFIASTVVMLLSSLSFHLAKKAIQKDDRKATTMCLLATLVLGLAFVYLQFEGFSQVVASGYFFTGSESTITTSFLYVVVIVHLAHLFGGLMALLVIIYNHFKQKYNSTQTLGIELGAMFWHFLDFLWLYLFLFFYFYK
ncbi:alternative cytochrome c oxidase polypeptide CoxO [Flavobacterium limnosediminis JC2902]|uniref:Alternative cytochrome c oxidase polypeptide CoxO n=1 Tax=Flavobacterium limnosediminis JC2902 TaxID=1341181 RepID=V6SST3_9FLAO|nr:cytochrome c oxidase subunit 3 [Flavobacterium limnosediminis]ESU29519.1 alternative cytochrome c oxidase polypeptide CoxO [Flavobacterium limnosediminis JC2902]